MAKVGAGGSFLAAQDERIGMRKGRPADGLFLLDNRAGRGATRNGNRLTEAFLIGLDRLMWIKTPSAVHSRSAILSATNSDQRHGRGKADEQDCPVT